MSSCKYQRSQNNHSFMRQSQSRSLDQASLRRAMVCHRRIQVVGGVVRCLFDVLRPVCLNWRCWFPSSIEMICGSCFHTCESLTSVTFDANSQLSRLEKKAFYRSGLQSIHLPGSLEVICEFCFASCESLASVTFDANSRLSRLEKKAFCRSGLQSIHLPGSLEVICESCFSFCNSLTSVTFDANSRLSLLAKRAFSRSVLQSIHLPGSLEVICESCFSLRYFLTSITFDPRSPIRARVSDLQAGIPFDCRPLAATRDARTGGRCCSVN
jgi:hypothetical protein